MLESEENGPSKLTVAVIVLVAVLVPLLVASYLVFGLQGPLSPATTTNTNQTGLLVTIPSGVASDQGLNFQPARIAVVIGVNNTITWVNEDPILHTVTSTAVPANATGFDSKSMNQGDRFTVTLSLPGTYSYDCTYHPGWMKGTIEVKPASSQGQVSVVLPSGVGGNPGLNFRPDSITVVVGVNNTIKWSNQDIALHTVTSTSVPAGAKSFDSGNMNSGATFSVTLTVPGTYQYDCTLHPGWMKATVVVKAA